MAKSCTVTVTKSAEWRFRRYYSSLQHVYVIIVINYLYTLSIIQFATVVRVINTYNQTHTHPTPPPKNYSNKDKVSLILKMCLGILMLMFKYILHSTVKYFHFTRKLHISLKNNENNISEIIIFALSYLLHLKLFDLSSKRSFYDYL